MRKSKDYSVKPADTIDTLIGNGAVVSGDLEFTGGLRIDGNVKGNITAAENNNSTLALSESAVVEGDISVPHVVVNGRVDGSITSSGHIQLQQHAKITGDVSYKALEMELGALVNGKLVPESATTAVYDVIEGGAEDTSHGNL